MDLIEVLISILIFLNSFLVYKVYDLSSRVTRIEEDIKWIIKMINGYVKKD